MRLCCCSEVAAPRLIHFFSLIERAKKTQARLLRGGGGYGPTGRPRLPSVSESRLLNGADLLKILGSNSDETNFSNLLAACLCVFSPFFENNNHVKRRLEKITNEHEMLESALVAAWPSSHKAANIAPIVTHWARSTPITKKSALAPVRPSSFRGSKN